MVRSRWQCQADWEPIEGQIRQDPDVVRQLREVEGDLDAGMTRHGNRAEVPVRFEWRSGRLQEADGGLGIPHMDASRVLRGIGRIGPPNGENLDGGHPESGQRILLQPETDCRCKGAVLLGEGAQEVRQFESGIAELPSQGRKDRCRSAAAENVMQISRCRLALQFHDTGQELGVEGVEGQVPCVLRVCTWRMRRMRQTEMDVSGGGFFGKLVDGRPAHPRRVERHFARTQSE